MIAWADLVSDFTRDGIAANIGKMLLLHSSIDFDFVG